jgi:hypothetical protein
MEPRTTSRPELEQGGEGERREQYLNFSSHQVFFLEPVG